MATAATSSDATDGPVLSLINKRLRALRKKHNRITQMEESVSQGKTLNKEQEETLRSKPHVVAAIDELEKLKQPLSVAVYEEINLALESRGLDDKPNASTSEEQPSNGNSSSGDNVTEGEVPVKESGELDGRHEKFAVIEDLLNLLYFGSMFDVKNQNDFTATMLTRTHERGCCLTYDCVTDDDAADLLGEKDLDLISILGGLLMSRPVNSSLSHKNALRSCIEHARLWLSNSDQLIGPASDITYAGLREKLNKIMASDYFTATPEMRAPIEVAAAAGNYGSFQVPVHGSMLPVDLPGQLMEGSVVQYEKTEQVTLGAEDNGTDDHPCKQIEEFENSAELQNKPAEHQDETGHKDLELTGEQHYVPRRSSRYRGARGMSGGGRRGYPNGRGGRGSSRGVGYQNGGGRHQYFNQGENYYPRNNNFRGRGGRGYGGNYNNYHGGVQAGYAPADS